MKGIKEMLTIVANIAEMILQSRISPHPQHLQRLESVKSQIEVLRHHLHPSDELLYFLIDREYYQIKNKLLAQHRKNTGTSSSITIYFTIFDKQTSTTQTAQIWKIELHRRQVNFMQTSSCVHELINLIREVVKQITFQYNFSELIRNKEASKKYIIDFRAQLASEKEQQQIMGSQFSMWTCNARMSQAFELEMKCYWRKNKFLPELVSSPYAAMQRKPRNNSEETREDSFSVGSLKELTVRKYRSIDEQKQAFELYDTELDVTILSSDSDSLSHSRHVVREITIGEVDEFELLIEENTNEDEMFLMENEALFESWQKYLNFNYN